jgi:hypothetical protein
MLSRKAFSVSISRHSALLSRKLNHKQAATEATRTPASDKISALSGVAVDLQLLFGS